MKDRKALIEKLRQAASEVDAAKRELDVSAVQCDTCTHRVFNNREDAKLFEELERMPQKLRRIANDAEKAGGVAR